MDDRRQAGEKLGRKFCYLFASKEKNNWGKWGLFICLEDGQLIKGGAKKAIWHLNTGWRNENNAGKCLGEWMANMEYMLRDKKKKRGKERKGWIIITPSSGGGMPNFGFSTVTCPWGPSSPLVTFCHRDSCPRLIPGKRRIALRQSMLCGGVPPIPSHPPIPLRVPFWHLVLLGESSSPNYLGCRPGSWLCVNGHLFGRQKQIINNSNHANSPNDISNILKGSGKGLYCVAKCRE